MNDEDQSEFASYRPPLSNDQFKKLQPYLRKVAKSMVRCSADRDDLVQEGNLRLLVDTTWTSPLPTAFRAMIDYLRKQGNRPDLIDDIVLNRWEGKEPSPLNALLGADLSTFDHLGLTKPERRIARLYWIEHRTMTEIGEAVGCSDETVSRTINRVRETFRQKWLTDGENE